VQNHVPAIEHIRFANELTVAKAALKNFHIETLQFARKRPLALTNALPKRYSTRSTTAKQLILAAPPRLQGRRQLGQTLHSGNRQC